MIFISQADEPRVIPKSLMRGTFTQRYPSFCKWVLLFGFLGCFFLLPSSASAHGIGGRLDLPVPLEYFLVGAALVLVFTFVWLAVYHQPKSRAPVALESKEETRSTLGIWCGRILGALGLLLAGVGVAAGLWGNQDTNQNLLPSLVWIGFWLVIPFWSALVGNVYPRLNPFRLMMLGWLRRTPLYPHWAERSWLVGVVVLAIVTWWELVYPQGDNPRHLAFAALGYAVFLWVWRGLVGAPPQEGIAPDGFGMYNYALGALSPFRWEQLGRVSWQGWFGGIAKLPTHSGMVWLVLVLIGSVTFDGVSATEWWQQDLEPWWVQEVGQPLGWSITTAAVMVGTLGLLGAIGLLYVLYLGASYLTARVTEVSLQTVAQRFAPTLIPIAFAYAFAHYFTLIIFEGQRLWFNLSDPFGWGWDIFGTAEGQVNFSLIASSSTWVWYVQVGAILCGHIAGIWLAHRRAMEYFPTRLAVRSQYGMLLLMVGLTMLGLLLLAAG